jgi:iron complex transport system substrate-binding protein
MYILAVTSLFCCLVSSASLGDQQASKIPQRIASLNICIDQLLWELVPRERLVSISYLTADPMWSSIADQVKNLPLNHGLAEEIIPLQPDIVLAGEFDNPDAVSLLQRLGVSVERLPLPRVLEDLSKQVLQVGALVGMQPQAEIMAARITQQLQNLAAVKHQSVIQQQPQRLTAYWYSSNGVVIGEGTLEHELMQLAGLRNLAAEQGIYGFSPLDLELLLVSKPQILIIEESKADAFSLAKEYVAHPALANANFTIIRLPAGLSGCAASVVGDVTDALKKALANQALH